MKIAFLGTSISDAGFRAAQFGWAVDVAHPDYGNLVGMQTRLTIGLNRQVTLLNFSKAGSNSSSFLSRIPAMLMSRPNVIILDSIANEVGVDKNIYPEDVKARVIAAARNIHALANSGDYGAPWRPLIGLMNMCPMKSNPKYKPIEPYVDAYCQAYVENIPLFQFFIDGQVAWSRLITHKPRLIDRRFDTLWFKSDGVHPTGLGMHRFWVPIVAKQLVKELTTIEPSLINW